MNDPIDPFAEADEDTGETKQSQNYIHIRIQRTSLSPRSNSLLPSICPPVTQMLVVRRLT